MNENEKVFSIRVDDSYHRSFVTCDGANINYRFGVKGNGGGYTELDIPKDDYEELMPLIQQLKDYAVEYGFDETIGNPKSSIAVTIGDDLKETRYYCDDDEIAKGMANKLEGHLVEKYNIGMENPEESKGKGSR